MSENIILLGHSKAAEIVYQLLVNDIDVNIAAVSVHKAYIDKPTFMGKDIVPFEDLIEKFPPTDYKLINAIGYSNVNMNREKIYREAKSLGYHFKNLIHSNVTNYSQNMGEGVIIMPGAVIEPFVSLGANCFIGSNVVVAHHSFVAENCWIASGTVISGEVTIQKNCFLGINVSIVNKISIGKYNVIGAGSVVSKNTPDDAVILSRSGEKHRFDSHNYVRLYSF